MRTATAVGGRYSRHGFITTFDFRRAAGRPYIHIFRHLRNITRRALLNRGGPWAFSLTSTQRTDRALLTRRRQRDLVDRWHRRSGHFSPITETPFRLTQTSSRVNIAEPGTAFVSVSRDCDGYSSSEGRLNQKRQRTSRPVHSKLPRTRPEALIPNRIEMVAVLPADFRVYR